MFPYTSMAFSIIKFIFLSFSFLFLMNYQNYWQQNNPSETGICSEIVSGTVCQIRYKRKFFWDHFFSIYAKLSKKITFLTHACAY